MSVGRSVCLSVGRSFCRSDITLFLLLLFLVIELFWCSEEFKSAFLRLLNISETSIVYTFLTFPYISETSFHFYFFLQFYSTETFVQYWDVCTELRCLYSTKTFVQYWDVCAVLRRLYSTETVGLALSHVNIKDLQTVYIPKPMLTWSHVRHLDLFYYADQGYTVIRIHTDNPGWWFFHCHYAFHSGNGMMLTLNEMPENKTKFDAFEPEEWQKKLQCGSWTTRKTSIIKTALGFDGKKLSVGWGGVVGGLILLYISGSRLKWFSPYSMFSDDPHPHHIDHRRTGWMMLQNKFELDVRMKV